MLGFLQAQADYTHLLSCICYLMMGSVCLLPSRSGNVRLPWKWLGVFGLLCALAELLELICLNISDLPEIRSTVFAVKALAYLGLLEFARSSFAAMRGRGPSRMVLLPVLGSIPLGVLPNTASVAALFLSLTWVASGALSAVILAIEARRCPVTARCFLRATALALGFHAIADHFTPPHIQLFAAFWLACGIVVSLRTSLHTGLGIRMRASLLMWPACVLAFFLSVGWWVTDTLGENTLHRLKNDVLARALISSSAINPTDMLALEGKASDVDKPQYKRLRHQLREMRASYPDCRFVYITAERRGKIVFLADAESEDSEDYSPPGQVYEEATKEFIAANRFMRPYVEGPATDRWGTWIFGVASIRYPHTNKVVGSVGMDVDAENWPKTVALTRIMCMGVILLLCVAAVAFFYALYSAREFAGYISASEKRYRTLVESSPNSVEVFGADGQYLSMNRASEMITGRTELEMLGRKYVDVWPAEAQGTVCMSIQQVMQGLQTSFEAELIRPDGRSVDLYVMLNPIADESGRIDRFIGISVDITALKQAQAALAAEKERLVTTLRSIGEGVIATDISGSVVLVNRAAESLTGWSETEAVGRPLEEVFHLADEETGERRRTLVQKILETGQPVESPNPTALVARDGAVRYIAESGAPIRDRTGCVSGIVIAFRDVTDRKIYGEKLNYLAHHDPLTGLPNRMLFADRLAQGLARARRERQQLAVMFVDLDRFKYVNDTMGHNTGDQLLTEVARRLVSCLREADTLARMGGDEFTIILNNVCSAEEATHAAERVLQALALPVELNGQEFFVSASIGISLYPAHGTDAETLVKNADTAMYRAKERGRDGYYLYTKSLNAAALKRMTLENSLRKAIEREELELHYQPQVSIATGATVGVEALARWRHPELGPIPPSQFIPLAEETGLITPISDWVLRTACFQSKQWETEGHGSMMIGVNVSARQFQQGDLAALVKQVLDESGLSPSRLNLEITESLLMQDPDHATLMLLRLRDMGVCISLDDFGTGYSSLSYLKRFPINTVKIDQSFVRDITQDADDAAIASAVIAMAHSLKLDVIAEGVETLEQLEFLRALGCDEIQGYFVSPPVPAEKLSALLAEEWPRAA